MRLAQVAFLPELGHEVPAKVSESQLRSGAALLQEAA